MLSRIVYSQSSRCFRTNAARGNDCTPEQFSSLSIKLGLFVMLGRDLIQLINLLEKGFLMGLFSSLGCFQRWVGWRKLENGYLWTSSLVPGPYSPFGLHPSVLPFYMGEQSRITGIGLTTSTLEIQITKISLFPSFPGLLLFLLYLFQYFFLFKHCT